MKDRAGQGKDAARGREPSRLWSVMYPSHFRMSENPFTSDADPKFLWFGGKRKESLEELARGILSPGGVQVVLGAHGAGKTQLANAVLDELGDRALAVVVPCAEYRGIDFMKLSERAFGISGDAQDPKASFIRFSEFLRRTAALGRPAVLIVDDAHRLDDSSLKELSNLAVLEENGTPLLRLAFFGESRFRDRVNDEANRVLFESAGVRLTLDPLTRDETAQYIRHRLRVAQCERELFTSDAVEEIFAFSQGLPLLINRACEAALSRAFYLGEQLVPQDTVREALKGMLAEKEAPAGAGGDPAAEGAAGGSGRHDEADDEDEPGIPAGQVRRRSRSWIAYAVLGCLLVALIALASFVLKGRSPAPPLAVVKKTVTLPPAPSAEKAETVPAVKGQGPDQPERAQEPVVSPGHAAPPAQKAEAVSAVKGQGPDQPERQQAPVVSSVQAPSREPEIRDEKKKPRQAARTRQAAVKSPRRESAPPAGGSPAADAGSAPVADRAGTASRETAPQKAEQVESGEVIDWVLKKRAGQQ